MNNQTPTVPRRLCFAVALCTLATLLLELSLTRIFSAVLFYHFAFVAISVALFGLGVGGVVAYYTPAAKDKAFTWSQLGRYCTKNALLVVVVLFVIINRPLYLSVSWLNALQLGLVYIVCALPFLVAGAVVSLAIANTVKNVSRVYFYDLIGAALGCLLLVPFLDWLGGPGTVIMAGAFFALAGGLWHSLDPNSGRQVKISVALAAVMALVVIGNRDTHFIDVQYAKGAPVQGEEYSQWNSFSRVSVGPAADSDKYRVAIDFDASTDIVHCDPDSMPAEERTELLASGPGLPYSVRPGAKALVIGAGGGPDVCRALITGSSDITAVEINPIIARDVMMDRYADASAGLYLRPEVRVAVEDGRSYVRRVDESYDLIQMTLVDSWASTASGAFALAENHLYTQESFREYVTHLSPTAFWQ
jgi:predicted membrane-bound spermidine synthase